MQRYCWVSSRPLWDYWARVRTFRGVDNAPHVRIVSVPGSEPGMEIEINDHYADRASVNTLEDKSFMPT